MNIGKYDLKHGLFLAPMAGVSDRSFRDICRRFGAEYTVSEMISAKALCYEQSSKRNNGSSSATAELAEIHTSEMPIAIQLFGREPEFMAKAAEMIENLSYKGCKSDTPPAAIDINMGCPVRKIVGNGEGSALMKEPELAAKIVKAVKHAVSIPVTVKIRAGWDSVTAPEFAKRIEDAGADLICVHARTREQMYLPGINFRAIEETKKAVSVPVVGNGDIYTAQNALEMLDRTGCDGLMIARGALGNPWIFTEIISALEKKDYSPPTQYERIALAEKHLEAMLNDKPERQAAAEAKKHIAWYIKGMNGAAAARASVMTAETAEDISKILKELKQKTTEGEPY
ncbi:MAG: tRNA dihydrouridine synthase DusB [Clostridia bacterium]|nr:tRNA dihydrouridine synthase DusB [Clostridia bacterium]